MRYVGLDISSTTIGISSLEETNGEIKLISTEYFKPDKKENIFELLTHTRAYIIDRVKALAPDVVVIEDIAMFMGKHSTADTIVLLAVLNRTIGLTIYEELGFAPVLLNVNSARSILRPKDHLGKLVKEEIPDILRINYGIKYDYKLKRNGEYAAETFDMADAIAIALAHIMNKDLPAKPKNKKTKKSRVKG